MKKIISSLIVVVFIFGIAGFGMAATWEIKITKDGVEQSYRVVTANEIKDIQVASSRTGKGVYAYFWEAMNDLFRAIEKENFDKQTELEEDDIKTRMRL